MLPLVGLVAGCNASLNPEQSSSLGQENKIGLNSDVPKEKQAAAVGMAAAPAQPTTAARPVGAQPKATAAASSSLAAMAAPASPGNPGYKIGPLDVLDITVFKVPDLSKALQVAETGAINYPLVGQIHVAGRTASEIETDLATKLGAKYLQSPVVTVYVKEFNSQRVTVEGAVKKPDVYPMRGKMTLMQAMAVAGGIDDNTSGGSVVVFRQKNGKKEVARFELDDIRAGRSSDPDLFANDLVVVETSAGKVAFNNLTKVVPVATLFRPF